MAIPKPARFRGVLHPFGMKGVPHFANDLRFVGVPHLPGKGRVVQIHGGFAKEEGVGHGAVGESRNAGRTCFYHLDHGLDGLDGTALMEKGLPLVVKNLSAVGGQMVEPGVLNLMSGFASHGDAAHAGLLFLH